MTAADRTVDGVEALRIEGLRKSFDKLEVLRGIDLVVREHEVICLIGASGSGAAAAGSASPAGNASVNTVPAPGSLSTAMVPRWRDTIP